MKRSEIEGKITQVKEGIGAKLTSPITAFIAGAVLGWVLGVFPKFIITIAAIGAIILGALWLLAEKEGADKDAGTAAGVGETRRVNGSGKASKNTDEVRPE